MQNLFRFLVRNGALLLFIGLELICLWLIVGMNERQQVLFYEFSGSLAGTVNARYTQFADYISLRTVNDSLMAENARLREMLYQRAGPVSTITSQDTATPFTVVPARVVRNSVNQRNNFMIIDRGSNDGVAPGMGVLHDQGPVGLVVAVTPGFSKVMSLLHGDAMVSSAIRRTNYFGALVWRSPNPTRMQLEAVPKHADIVIGDTVVTTGQSFIFPGDLVIGVVDTFFLERGSNFFTIDVVLQMDISRIDNVYVAHNERRLELKSLEE